MSYQQPHIQRPQVSGVCGRSGNWIYGSTTGRVGCHNAMKYSLNIRRKTGVVINDKQTYLRGYGYATSFLDETFGGLVRATKDLRVMDIELISDDEPRLVEKVREYIFLSLFACEIGLK